MDLWVYERLEAKFDLCILKGCVIYDLHQNAHQYVQNANAGGGASCSHLNIVCLARFKLQGCIRLPLIENENIWSLQLKSRHLPQMLVSCRLTGQLSMPKLCCPLCVASGALRDKGQCTSGVSGSHRLA